MDEKQDQNEIQSKPLPLPWSSLFASTKRPTYQPDKQLLVVVFLLEGVLILALKLNRVIVKQGGF